MTSVAIMHYTNKIILKLIEKGTCPKSKSSTCLKRSCIVQNTIKRFRQSGEISVAKSQNILLDAWNLWAHRQHLYVLDITAWAQECFQNHCVIQKIQVKSLLCKEESKLFCVRQILSFCLYGNGHGHPIHSRGEGPSDLLSALS